MSQTGKEFLQKALHPVSDLKSPGIPDYNETDLYRTEFRITAQIGAPAFPDSSPLALKNYDALVWCVPGDNTAAYVAVGTAGTNFNTATLAPNGIVSSNSEVYAYQLHFNENLPGDVLKGVLSDLPWRKSADPPPPIELRTVPARSSTAPTDSCVSPPRYRYFGTTWGKLMPRRWRTTASSVTMSLIANATQDQGSVYSWEGGRSFSNGPAVEAWAVSLGDAAPIQPVYAYAVGTVATGGAANDIGFDVRWNIGPEGFPPDMPVLSGKPFQTGYSEVTQTKVTSVPFDEESMFAQSPHLYATQARHGVYSVMRLLGPVQPLQNSNDVPHTIVTPLTVYDDGLPVTGEDWTIPATWDTAPYLLVQNGNSMQAFPAASLTVTPLNACGPPAALPDGTPTGFVLSGASVPPWLSALALSPLQRDTSIDNVSQSVTIWRALDPSATIQFKRLVSIEAAPLENSPARPFVTPPCDVDARAIALYYEISHRMMSVHPASANDLGTLLNEIASVAGKIIPAVAGVASFIAPEFSPVFAAGAAAGEAAAYGLGTLGRAIHKGPKQKPKPKPKAGAQKAKNKGPQQKGKKQGRR